MKLKIRLLMCLVETLNLNIPKHDVKAAAFLDYVRQHFAAQAQDKAWYEATFASLKQAILEDKPSSEWLKEQFAVFGIFEASAPFQKSELAEPYCMSFVYQFHIEQVDTLFCVFQGKIDPKIKHYLKRYAKNTSQDKLAPGDIITYRDKAAEFTHIAIYVGNVGGVDYVASKLGKNLGVYLHPLEHVPDNYGKAYFHQYTQPKKQAILHKLEALREGVEKQLEPQAQQAASAHVSLSLFPAAERTKEKTPVPEAAAAGAATIA